MGKAVMPMRLSAEQLARMEASRARRLAGPVEVVVSGVTLRPSQRDALMEAERLAGGLAERRKAAMLVRLVEGQLKAARDGAAVEAAIEDTLLRAEARGEAFEVETVAVGEFRRDDNGGLARLKGQPILDVQTVRRARRIDGIASLYRAGHLDDDQLRIADEYRQLVEAARPPVGVATIEPRVGRAWADPEAPMAAAIERGQAGALLSRKHAALTPEQAAVLQAVAGRGESIRGLTGGGRRWQTNRSLLIEALTLSDKVRSVEKM
ncbi:Uncharacterised protein [Brevundimonas vesicularis]|uniref:Uncharacterized protein n=1 Tax=Brevundimonas vesicularis TaxID=41276 RepID=A0A2X1BYM3_BREVE|nr:hypothetical protein [Brevundimonas vesicularis]SPU55884.1 Uncharacterised protein [Brevundimonas vesicularis]